MKLISADASPFARKCRILIHEAGLGDRVEVVSLTTTPINTDPQVASANPAGKIPALLRDSGPALYDSRVITRYLDEISGAGLYPQARIWEVLTLEATADAMMDAAVLMVYEHRVRPADKVDEGWIEAQWAKITRSLNALDARWMSHLSGPLDMAQIGRGHGAHLSRFPPRRPQLARHPPRPRGLAFEILRTRQHGRHRAQVNLA